ncbi:glycosyltransferase [Constantimarinum furrinae]|uniref:Glycosyl transferase n=1 Tax=Constantimarinum furrinae TaxID=2562285 RepID=A0A7G8PR77_9FLAO|nr:glycosyltransferase [Constantimarinum furrinae]QNJ96843.1 Glycosyl transferase [Constantimarinum furrinae]
MLLLYVFIAVVLMNCIYFLLFSKFSFINAPETQTEATFPVSVIICAKNEAKNLRRNIPLWLKQQYPQFELILVNDASSDKTLKVMESFAEKDPRIKIVNVKNNEAFWGNKKYALTLGIKRAVHTRLLFTDADCEPATKHWIKIMVSHFSEEKQVVLGYGAYSELPGLLNALIRYETLMTAVQYFSYAIVGIPYMGVGRNLAYTSTIYYKNNGFMSHIQLPSGDDDLFVNEVASKNNTAVCFDAAAFTYSIPKKTWKDWIIQKRRHITTSGRYKPHHKFLLGTYFVSNLLFWILAVACLIMNSWIIVVALIGLRFIIQYLVIGYSAKKLKESSLIPFIPLLDLFLVFIQMFIFISNRTAKSTRWK